jgi:hypothetical protein
VIYSIGIDQRDERGAGDDVTTWSKEYRCADYGVNCPPDARHLAAYAALLLAVCSFIVGLARGASSLRHWRMKRRNASA